MADKTVRQWVNKQKNETETEANININWGGYYRNSMAGQAWFACYQWQMGGGDEITAQTAGYVLIVATPIINCAITRRACLIKLPFCLTIIHIFAIQRTEYHTTTICHSLSAGHFFGMSRGLSLWVVCHGVSHGGQRMQIANIHIKDMSPVQKYALRTNKWTNECPIHSHIKSTIRARQPQWHYENDWLTGWLAGYYW